MRINDGRKRGWFWANNAVFDEWGAALGPIGLAVYLCLCRHADSEGQCYPSVATIGRKCGISKFSTLKALRTLEECSLIKRTHRTAKDGDPDTNIYTLQDMPHAPGVVSDRHQGSAPHAPGVVRDTNQGSAPHAPGVVRDTNQGSAPHAPHEGIPPEGRPLRTTTTTTAGPAETDMLRGDSEKNSGGGGGKDQSQKNTQPSNQQLAYPQGMGEDEQMRATAMLEGHQNAQEMLDTVEAARRAGQIKKSPLALLAALIRRDKNGSFDPLPGHEIAKERQRSGKANNGGTSKAVELSNLRAEVNALERMATAGGGEIINKQLMAARAKLEASAPKSG